MLSYDVQDKMDLKTEQFSDLGIIQVRERSYSKKGVKIRQQSYEPSSERYANLRKIIASFEKNIPQQRQETLNHVSPLVHATMTDRPIWVNGKSSFEELMKKMAF